MKTTWESIRHAHRDYYGGLDGVIGHLRTHMLEDVSLYIGGDGIFRERSRRCNPTCWCLCTAPARGSSRPCASACPIGS